MQDERIVELYWSRNEQAIRETAAKYENYLMKIADNILHNAEDSEESVNDTYLKAWNSMPPHRPSALSLYLGKIARENSIDIYRKRCRDKRRVSEYAVSLNELGECVPNLSDTQQEAELSFIADIINEFLRSLPSTARNIFLCRYYYMEPIKDIARCSSMSESKVKSILHRSRQKLRKLLEKEGVKL
ncbi:MAG: RNA polymerase sigma factor [Clostridia bacterium]|nr:RNA polymerase sigma factor [Clostridia bacterium]